MKNIINIWWEKGNNNFSIINYKESWSNNDIGKLYKIFTNDAHRNTKDSCFSLTVHVGYLSINYTNFNFNKKYRSKLKEVI